MTSYVLLAVYEVIKDSGGGGWLGGLKGDNVAIFIDHQACNSIKHFHVCSPLFHCAPIFFAPWIIYTGVK